jgi:hypothetical protein
MRKINIIKLVIAAVLTVSAMASVNAQEIKTNRFQSREDFVKRFPQLNLVNLDDVPHIVRTPTTEDISRYEQDKENDAKEFPQGNIKSLISMSDTLGIKNGVWSEKGGYRIWTLCISVPDVRYFLVLIRNLHLSPDAKLYAYSPDGRYVKIYSEEWNFGVRKSSRNYFPIYAENYFPAMVIQIVEPDSSEQSSTLEIFGIGAEPIEKSLLQSLNCKEDIACYPNWDKDSYSKILIKQ